jgi:predicted Fe-S protein YdhL (DUF1289 family)
VSRQLKRPPSNTRTFDARKHAARHGAAAKVLYDRGRMSRVPPDPLASPCVRNCCLDDDNVCMGCGRALAEIVQWGTASDADKKAILARSRERLMARTAAHRGRP